MNSRVRHVESKITPLEVLVELKQGPSSATTEIRHPLLQFHQDLKRSCFRFYVPDPLAWVDASTKLHWNKSILLTQFRPSSLPLLGTTVLTEYDDPSAVQFSLGGLVWQLSVPEFGVALGLYTENFMEADSFFHLHRHIHYAPSSCWAALIPAMGIYDPSCFKASTPMRQMHAFDLAYFIALAFRHQTKRHRKGVIKHRPLRDSSSSTLWTLENVSIILITHTHRLDVLTMYRKYAPHEVDRASSWGSILFNID
ncbi:hypothetical protein GOBAR_AA11078 [Gossypium barbadense]|uniref:Uncharacterized protein n=1 Tax=Gossypium barbadense TaxID=3634 RepID=A0A2P5Y1W1_GOSBA|nr:hypothetical protein GOBAR_AA11078 [Gossypium barbadense]